MRVTLDALEVLDAIARRGSFAAAAESLHRVPSAITYTIQKLEEDLGVALFDRRGHRAILTEPGRELLREGKRLLSAAHELEGRVKRVATGYEVELRLAVNDVIPFERLVPLIEAFYANACGTRLRLCGEVYGGAWDALAADRADLAIGAPGEGPPGGGYVTRHLGETQWAFMVAPSHPLAAAAEPIPPEEIANYRSIAAADTSRHLPPRTSGLLSGQDVLTVPDMYCKIAFQRAGLGVGFLPLHMTRADVADGRLVIKQVVEAKSSVPLYLAWRTAHKGKALEWWVERLSDERFKQELFR